MSNITRREALGALALTGAAAAAGAVSADGPQRPGNVKGSPEPASPSKALLTPEHIRAVGWYRLPPDFDDLWYAYGQNALRMVGDELRLFTAGNITKDFPLLEYGVPEAKPGATLATAPLLVPRKNWGPVPMAKRITGGTMGSVLGGLHYDVKRNGLWWSYGDIYAPVDHYPSKGFTAFNADGTTTLYGPWRTQWNGQQTRGQFIPISQAFADRYTNGRNICSMASAHNADSPWGAILSAEDLPDPFTTPPDVAFSKHWTVGNQGLILHDYDHPQARDASNYRFCNWKERYDCSVGSTIDPGVPTFGGPIKGSSGEDTMLGAVFVDLPDVEGLLYFGTLTATPKGYRAPGDPDGLAHNWYGAALSTKNSKGQERFCCHGQYDPYWDATGPGAHYRMPMGWIYNPNDLVATAQKKAKLWSRVPTSTFAWVDHWSYLADRPVIDPRSREDNYPPVDQRACPGFFRSASFHAPSRRIFVFVNEADRVTFPGGKSRPAIAVFEVK